MQREEKRCIQGANIMAIVIKHHGSFKKTERLFKNLNRFQISNILDKYGKIGVDALSASTPINSGETSKSWGYEVEKTQSGYAIVWTNSNINDGVNIAVILQTGHGTGTGGYVKGKNYINPALRPVFDALANEAWQEVTKR